jgi:hypothetical protein
VACRGVYGVWLGLLGPYEVGGARCIAGGDWKSVFWILDRKVCFFGPKKEPVKGNRIRISQKWIFLTSETGFRNKNSK